MGTNIHKTTQRDDMKTKNIIVVPFKRKVKYQYEVDIAKDIEVPEKETLHLAMLNVDEKLNPLRSRYRKGTLPGKLAIEDQIYKLEKGFIKWQKYDLKCKELGKDKVHEMLRANKGKIVD